MTSSPPLHIALFGGGLAGAIAAAALSRQLPETVRLTHVKAAAPDTDLFYGSVTAPGAYSFNLANGVTEPALVQDSDTAFSWGTLYEGWGRDRSWVQCFHLPLPVNAGVLFQHYLAQQKTDALEPFLISAVAARHGAFAHPPEQRKHPLSRAEYGYQMDPRSYAALFRRAARSERITLIEAGIDGIDCSDGAIEKVRLSDGSAITADLYVDCTGPAATLLSAVQPGFSGDRRIGAVAGDTPAARLGPPRRTVKAAAFGWQSETPLKGRTARLTVFDPGDEEAALTAHGAAGQSSSITLGRRERAWSGNCVGLGHAAGVLEPLTPAPLMILQRDVERLLGLIPITGDMAVERREYNRQFDDDFSHAWMFNRTLFETDGLPQTAYWQAARAEPCGEKLDRKLEQFESRGLLVAYDLEPFNPEDWLILHYGMGRQPERHDRFADIAPARTVQPYLAKLKEEIGKVVRTMPDHHDYMTGLEKYLAKNKG